MANRKKTPSSSVNLEGTSPHSDEAETAVISALLKNSSIWDPASIGLSDRDFFRPRNGLIYRFISELIDAQKPVDVGSLHERLKRAGKVKEAGGLAYLKALERAVSGPDSIQRCVEIVQENAQLRALDTPSSYRQAVIFDRRRRPGLRYRGFATIQKFPRYQMKKTSSNKVNAETESTDAESRTQELSGEEQLAKFGFFLSEDLERDPESDQSAKEMADVFRTILRQKGAH